VRCFGKNWRLRCAHKLLAEERPPTSSAGRSVSSLEGNCPEHTTRARGRSWLRRSPEFKKVAEHIAERAQAQRRWTEARSERVSPLVDDACR